MADLSRLCPAVNSMYLLRLSPPRPGPYAMPDALFLRCACPCPRASLVLCWTEMQFGDVRSSHASLEMSSSIHPRTEWRLMNALLLDYEPGASRQRA